MTVELVIDQLGSGGDGLATHNDTPYYVPYSAPGDRLLANPVEERGNGFLANITEILSSGPERTKPLCRHFGTCGGCLTQHLKPGLTAGWKRQRIVDCLAAEGLTDVKVSATVTSPPQSRRRVELIAAKRKKGVMIGYHLRRSHQIFDVGECPLIDPSLLALVKPLRMALPNILPRNTEARLTITATDNGPDLLITAGIEINLMIREQLATFANENGLSRISWTDKPGQQPEVIAAVRPAEVMMGDMPVIISAGGFLQATETGEYALVERALEILSGAGKVIDLFAGCGSFSFPLARQSSVHAVEGDEELASALQQAANRNILSITSEVRDLFRRPLLPGELDGYDGAVIDPPRAGARTQSEELAQSDIQTIAAVSCNPVTFARDMAILIEGGYQLQSVLPIDQFLWSPHVEMIADLKRS
jgi:23S rRNA (uracil1939-C5)-methyltransferase